MAESVFVSKICDFRALQITQNNVSHPKSLMINYIKSKLIVLICCVDSTVNYEK